jgi:hypothetical protein
MGKENKSANICTEHLHRKDFDTYKVLQLPPGLFDNSVLTAQDNTHATEVADLRPTNDERINVETSSSKNAGHAGKNTRFVLHQAIEDVSGNRKENFQ